MEFKDRVANKPNRVKLTYEDSGASSFAVVELADEPIEEGTPLNKATLDKMQKQLNAYVVGNVLITSTNQNPEEYLGGTWKLIDKGFKNVSGVYTFDKKKESENELYCDGVYSTANSNILEKMVVNYQRVGQTIRFRLDLYIKNGVEFDDSGNMSIAKIYFPDFGVERLFRGYADVAVFNDASDANGLLMSFSPEGYLTQDDVITSDHSNYVWNYKSTNEAFEFEFTTPVEYNRMLDDFCDKFYWKRIG